MVHWAEGADQGRPNHHRPAGTLLESSGVPPEMRPTPLDQARLSVPMRALPTLISSVSIRKL